MRRPITLCVAPLRLGFQRLKALSDDPFSLFLLPLSSPPPPAVLCLPLFPLCISGKEEGRACVPSVMELPWSKEEVANPIPSWFVDSISCFSMLPSPVWYVCRVWVAPGWSILWVYFLSDVATAVRVVTPEDAIMVSVAVPFPVAMDWLALRTFRWGMRQVASMRSVTKGDTFVAVSWKRCQEGTEVVEVISSQCGQDNPLFHYLSLHWFRSHVVVLGVEPQLGKAVVVHAFLWCSVVALSCSSGEFVVAPACAASRPRSVSRVQGGSACGPSTLGRTEVVVLALLLLWPDLSVRRVAETTVAPCVVSSSESECCELLYLSGGANFGVPGTVREVGSLQLVCGFLARVARLAVDWLAVVFPLWRTVAGKSRRDALGRLHRIWVLPYSVSVVFPELCLGGSSGGSPRTGLRSPFVVYGGGSSQECSVFILGHRYVAPLVSLFISKFSPVLVGLCVSPWCGWFASFLAPGVLLQMVI
ncbi:hypothetical protein Taro_036009 [Colocasia esculenta]|uniref:Uncharacterized protein n=1 Tax=Colocasia esculenta TaxID=4460 RepID=A0A843WC50_COLES|nr:hypothetical protein [Colocasia esculenta]